MSNENVYLLIDEMGKKNDVDGLITMLRSNFKGVYASAAFEALCKLNDPRSVPVLIDLLNADYLSSSIPKEDTIEALGKLKDSRAVPALINFIKSRDLTIKRGQDVASIAWLQKRVEAAITALGEIGDPQAVDILVKIIKRVNFVGEGLTHEWAVRALAKIGDRKAVPALIDALKSKDSRVNGWAAWALGVIGDPRAVPVLIEAIKKKDDKSLHGYNISIKKDSAEALGKLGDRRAIKPLQDFLAAISLRDDRRETIMKALQALGVTV
jgi:HEAT repeat protein